MIYQNLFDRIKEPKVVRAGLIGTGDYGTAIVTQASHMPLLQVPAVADLDVEAARLAYHRAGISDDGIAVCDSRASALHAMEAGKHVIVEDAMILMELPLDVIAEATATTEAGSRYAREAIQHGKHVAMVNKETDSAVGPILKHLAEKAGVVYTAVDGDQPGLLIGLVSWARTLGYEVLCGGLNREFVYDPVTWTVSMGEHVLNVAEKDRWVLDRIPAGAADRYVRARREVLAELYYHLFQFYGNGAFMSELVVAANSTGLLPDTPRANVPVVRTVEIPEVLCPVEDGGILHTRGAIDIAGWLRTEDMPPSGGGVWVVLGLGDDYGRNIASRKGHILNSRGSTLLIYRPHHLCGVETTMSILCAGLAGIPTGGSTVRPVIDIVGRATHDLSSGATMGDGFSPDLDAEMVAPVCVADGVPLPYFLIPGNKLSRDVPAGTVITKDMIVPPPDSALWSLRMQQDAHFLG